MRSIGVALVAAGLFAGCSMQAPGDADLPLIDIEGVSHGTLQRPARGRWSTLIFVSTDCPVSNRYAPAIRRICAEYEPAGAQCTLVYTDAGLPENDIRRHAAEFRLDLPVVLDPERVLVARAGATTTPQAAVFGEDGALAYSGRIDDFHAELGRTRHAATEHDLRNALDDLVAGRAVRKPRADPLGCYIE